MNCTSSVAKVEKWPENLPGEIYWRIFTNNNRANAHTAVSRLPKPPDGTDITSNPNTSAARIRTTTWRCFTPSVMTRYTMRTCTLQNPRRCCAARKETGPASETFEPYEAKVSRTVLRGVRERLGEALPRLLDPMLPKRCTGSSAPVGRYYIKINKDIAQRQENLKLP